MMDPVLIVAGPTASGKSELALQIAERMDGVIINADSMQVYRELAILTARPGAAALARAEHRLYGVLSGATNCSAGLWRELALKEIAEAHRAGKLPIVTGGTGLYLTALVEGVVAVPEIPEEIRAEARALCDRLGTVQFHKLLAERDPLMAARLPSSDRQRLIRAWEVFEATGRSLVEWQAETGAGGSLSFRYGAILLDPPRQALYAACERRFDRMIEAGALDEVKALQAHQFDPRLPVMKSIGVPELGSYLAGEISLEEAVARAKLATRRLVKRQATWFRHHPPAPQMMVAQHSESLPDEIFNFIRQFLLTDRAPSV